MSSDGRDSILSSLVSLSESICERAIELQKTEDVKDVVERGKRLQKKTKKAASTSHSKKSRVVTVNDVQINCCQMHKVRNAYRKASPMIVVDLKKSDSYDEVVDKICEVVELERDEGSCRLFTGKCAVIPNADIVIDEEIVKWSLGGLLSKRHVAPDKLILGVGIYEEDCSEMTRSRKRSNIKGSSSQPKPKIKPVSTNVKTTRCKEVCVLSEVLYQKIMVYYSSEDQLIPLSRQKVWDRNNESINEMDKERIFQPEYIGYRVVKIIMYDEDDTEFPILQPDESGNVVPCRQTEGDSLLCFNSCTNVELNSFCPVSLVVLCRTHPSCEYSWLCLNDQSKKFPSTPVIYVRDPHMYKCCIIVNNKRVCSVNFDVIHKPVTLSSTYALDEISGATCSSELIDPPVLRKPSRPIEISIAPPTFDSLQFDIKEIMESTNNLNKKNEIGKGGFGTVFLASNLRCSGTKAAIKVLTKEGTEALLRCSESGLVERELKVLMKFRHQNILQIMGYCFHQELKALVYTFMDNGSLYDWIHQHESNKKQTRNLEWDQRIQIMKDVFRGLAYLHSADPPLVHQDVKPHNVLLDKHFQAVIGDFGFAIELPKSVSGRTLVTVPLVARTEGYFAPEIVEGKISPLSDVYSCGVMVLETYSGLMSYDIKRTDRSLVDFTEDYRLADDDTDNKFLSIADSAIEKPNLAVSQIFRKVSNSCLQRYSKRPTAKTALSMWDP